MTPGAPNPLMWGQGDPLDELGKIDRSLRFRASASAKVSRVFAAGNPQKCTIIAFLKPSSLGNGTIFAANNTGSQYFIAFINSSGQLEVSEVVTSLQYRLVSNRLFRDFASHFELMIAIDTTQATPANRVRVYIDGVEITSWATASYPALNYNHTYLNANGKTHFLSGQPSIIGLWDGLMSSVIFVDGQQLAPTGPSGKHPRTGQWRPKTKVVRKALADAGGVNSCFLPFDNPTNTTTLCADASSKGNNWTASGVSLSADATYDSMLDTPTNNFCTLNALNAVAVNGGAGVGAFNIIDGALTSQEANATNTVGTVQATMAISTGKWYWEILGASIGGSYGTVGVKLVNSTIQFFGLDPNDYAYRADGQKYNNTGSAYGASWTTNDIIGVALDMDAGTLTFYKNGVSQGVAFSGLSGMFVPACGDQQNGSANTLTFNFGQRSFSYSLPTGFKSLCTKNLKFPAVSKSSSALSAVTDTGANILSTLAASESWSSYVRIVKRRDSAEGWRWMFSDDPTNYMDSSSTAAKAAIPAFGGTSYIGYSLKVSASNGVATGRLTHVNGVADTVTDSLGNSRKVVILKNEATGSWYVYHPDLTAGKLLYLEQQAAETTDTTISTVLANSFVAAAALPSGTYRWIALAEADGFLKIGKYIGAADVPYVHGNLTPCLTIGKRTDAAGEDWFNVDSVRDPYNSGSGTFTKLNATSGDGAMNYDAVSGGIKMRGTGIPNNSSGATYAFIEIAAFPFRYANAR